MSMDIEEFTELTEQIRTIVEDAVSVADQSYEIQNVQTRLHRIEQRQEILLEGTANGLNWIVAEMKKQKREIPDD